MRCLFRKNTTPMKINVAAAIILVAFVGVSAAISADGASDATVITGEAQLSSEGNGPAVLKKGSHVSTGGAVKTGSGAALFGLGNRVFVKEGAQSSMVLTNAPSDPNSPNVPAINVNLSTGELYAGTPRKEIGWTELPHRDAHDRGDFSWLALPDLAARRRRPNLGASRSRGSALLPRHQDGVREKRSKLESAGL